MTARQGLPEEVWTDNGTNFVGAERELRYLDDGLEPDKIVTSAANKGIR